MSRLQRDLLAGFFAREQRFFLTGGGALACGAESRIERAFPEFRRLKVVRAEESSLVDLVIDRAPPVDANKATFGPYRVDTLREIAANKVSTLIDRSEIKDLVDLRELLASGIDLAAACADAQKKDGGADPATVAWVLEQVSIGPGARLPGGVDPEALAAFRDELIVKLRALAMAQVRRGP